MKSKRRRQSRETSESKRRRREKTSFLSSLPTHPFSFSYRKLSREGKSAFSLSLYLARLRRRNAGISIPIPPFDEAEAVGTEAETESSSAAAAAEATSLGAAMGALEVTNGATAEPARPPSPKPVAISVIDSSPEAAREGSTTAPKIRLASGSTRS